SWDLSGNVDLVFDGANALAELTQTADTWLGQLMILDPTVTSLSFDLTTVAAGPGDVLEILFDDQLLATIDLTSQPPQQRLSVPLASVAGQYGVIRFRLTGPEETASIIRLDNVTAGTMAENEASALDASVNGGDVNRAGIREWTVEFDQPVTLDSAGVLALFNHTTGQSISVNGAVLVGNGTASVTWVLADGPGGMADIVLPDGWYTAEVILTETTPNLVEPFEFEFHKLAGDVDGDGLVNFNDYFEVRENFDTFGPAFRPGDGDGDGLVNFNDYFAVRENFDAVLPPMTSGFAASFIAASSGSLLDDEPVKTTLVAAPPPAPVEAPPARGKLLSDRDDEDAPPVITASSPTPQTSITQSDDPYENGKGLLRKS
ncbi:MAG: hypothetical protein KF861_14760, partial [Planctomycetaceae bacterium]|nr:hypothetical protein [Planctomycetaceae bacterium]